MPLLAMEIRVAFERHAGFRPLRAVTDRDSLLHLASSCGNRRGTNIFTSSDYSRKIIPTIFFSVSGGSIVSLSVAQFLEIRTAEYNIVFAAAALFCLLLFTISRLELPHLTTEDHAIALCVGSILMIPRLQYLFEQQIGISLNVVCWDDWWHIQEMASIVYSEYFPPRSTFRPDDFLSFYYAPWLFGAAIFLAGPLATIKQALFINVAYLSLLIGYGIVYAGHAMFREDAARRRMLVGVIILYGGGVAYYSMLRRVYHVLTTGHLPADHPPWQAAPFGFNIHFENLFSSGFWAPHHVSAVVAIFFAAYCLSREMNAAARAVCGITLALAAFSSVFVTIGALPLLVWLVLRHRVPVNALLAVFGATAIIAAPLIWMYLCREGSGFIAFGALRGVWQRHPGVGFPAFIAALILMFLPIVVAIGLARKEPPAPWSFLLVCLPYLISTYFIAYSGANNYAMRGGLVPVCAMLYFSVPGLIRLCSLQIGWKLLMLPFFMGGLWQIVAFSTNAWQQYHKVSPFQAQALAANLRHGVAPDAAVLQAAGGVPHGWYLLETNKPAGKAALISPDRELINADNPYRLTLRRLVGAGER
ncbi:MAG: hypothetical protein P4M00_20160 [Azospirillaceae bacterium]|nr:hypothetical protein [Azospirillaceae bacterium]